MSIGKLSQKPYVHKLPEDFKFLTVDDLSQMKDADTGIIELRKDCLHRNLYHERVVKMIQ